MYLSIKLANKYHKPIKSTEEKNRLIALAKSGDRKAMDRIFRAYIRFLIKITTKYTPNDFITSDDFFQDSFIGFSEAVKRFNPALKVKFDSYMVWWARCYITKNNRKMSTVTIPHGYLGFRKRWYRENKDEPVLNSNAFFQFCDSHCIPYPVDFYWFVKSTNSRYSLDQKVEESKPTTFKDLLYEDNNLDNDLNNKELAKIISIGLNRLKDKEKFVAIHLYGLFGNHRMDTRAIASKLKTTHQNVCLIDKSARKKLKNILIGEKQIESIVY